MNLEDIRKEIRATGTPSRAKANQWYFKTGKGEYGYGDVFLGLTVPQSRIIAKKYHDLSLADIKTLLMSTYHEERLIALIILVAKYKKGDSKMQQRIYDLYLSHTNWINNWDLVDSSAPYIVGDYILRKEAPISVLLQLAHSSSVWEKRIAIVSTFSFIASGQSETTFAVSEILVHDKHDLIQKAVGWMLREVGKRVSQEQEESFLKRHYKTMPRTMLRYAIERFDLKRKQAYMLGTA